MREAGAGRAENSREFGQPPAAGVIVPPFVTIVVDGHVVEGSTPAVLQRNVVLAPLRPYVDGIARTVAGTSDGAIVLERAGRTCRLEIGSALAWNGASPESLAIAPYLRAGEPIIPLGAVARALGAHVAYDPSTRTLQIDVPLEPLATMTPFAWWSPPSGPLPTFAPTATPAPRASASAIPLPRRTPILVEPEP